ncbi:MAG: serine/threonine-protein kinase [Myxococcales bacterium]|nr:serine/threonine-protein kinase [Myxococcales bacterium]
MVLDRHAALVRRGEEIALVVRGQTLLYPQGQPLQDLLPLPAGTVLPIQLGPHGPVCVVKVGLAVPFGRYLVVGEIGEGGMGVVYQALDLPPRAVDGRLVALKMITKRHREVDPHAQQRFLLESSILYQLDHPHVVRIFEAREEETAVYIAMEYLRGVSLRRLALQLRQQKRPFPPAVAAAMMSQVCEGLHAVHELRSSEGTPYNIVHRDVSPSNIITSRAWSSSSILASSGPMAGCTRHTRGCWSASRATWPQSRSLPRWRRSWGGRGLHLRRCRSTAGWTSLPRA